MQAAKPTVPRRRVRRHHSCASGVGLLPLAITSLLLNGCVFRSENPAYPSDWTSPTSTHIGKCPDIAGTYPNQGEMHLESGISCGEAPHRHFVPKGEWSCSMLLTRNLGISTPAPLVTLSQPDGDWLVVDLHDKHAGDKQHVLRRGQDFECNSDGLIFSDTSSMLEGPWVTAFGILFLSGGVVHHTRTFNRNTAGEMVMKVHQTEGMYHIVIGGTSSTTGYVHWQPAPPQKTTAKEKP